MDNLQPNDAVGAPYIPQLKTNSTTEIVAYTFAPAGIGLYCATANATSGTPMVSYAARAETEYERQERLFHMISQAVLGQYQGQFVVSRNGEIVDSDTDLTRLGRRFFGEHGDVSVYITKAGGPIEVTIATPFIR
jgi:hypothetical protein